MQALLDFENNPLHLGNPRSYVEVYDGKLFQDGRHTGSALDLFDVLQLAKTNNFFPAWAGFIGYEFARYFGLETHKPDGNFPDAAFLLFDRHCEGSEAIHRTPHPRPLSTQWRGGTESAFLSSIEHIQEEIRAGDVYQVNLTRQFQTDSANPFAAYQYLKQRHPTHYMGVLEGPDWSIVSGSPERLFRLENGVIITKPIAGTKPNKPGMREELLSNPKELAEHAMLVDLMRSDLAKICHTGTVQVPHPFTVEEYPHVLHLVSEVTGQTSASLLEIMRAIFPGGTITGAPKENVMRSITRHEPVPRGPYTGSFGYISSNGVIDFNILIRSLFIGRHKTFYSAGAGIVIGSDPASELAETEQKVKHFSAE